MSPYDTKFPTKNRPNSLFFSARTHVRFCRFFPAICHLSLSLISFSAYFFLSNCPLTHNTHAEKKHSSNNAIFFSLFRRRAKITSSRTKHFFSPTLQLWESTARGGIEKLDPPPSQRGDREKGGKNRPRHSRK